VHSWYLEGFYATLIHHMSDSKHEMKPHHYENYQYPDQFGKWLGYQVHSIHPQDRTAEVRLLIREDHLSPARRVHGGVVSSFFDYAFGATVFSLMGPKDFCSTVELKVNYLKPIELGDLLIARTEVVFKGKRLCVLRALAFRNDEREPVAMATATFNVVSKKSSSEG